eukprot:TRINITY_DN4919_c0_g4_i4.p4 TRINITY_DN4919_c0_g4~~TRINITY_DN4919_c0_g4_i4.p4  ORF type:complete len:104 (+),score=37.08 TRINITY_DN4919_c0_g4_i4:873-1184(+)
MGVFDFLDTFLDDEEMKAVKSLAKSAPIVVFSKTSCGYCRMANKELMGILKANDLIGDDVQMDNDEDGVGEEGKQVRVSEKEKRRVLGKSPDNNNTETFFAYH